MLPDHQRHSAKEVEQTASRFASARARYEAAKVNLAGSDNDPGEQSSEGDLGAQTEASTQRSPEPMRPAAAFEGGEHHPSIEEV